MSLDLKGYVHQCVADSKRWFPDTSSDLGFHALAMVGEAGELANLVKKVLRGTISLEEARMELAEEAIDVFIYLSNIFALLGVDPDRVYAIKRAKNEKRFGGTHKEAA